MAINLIVFFFGVGIPVVLTGTVPVQDSTAFTNTLVAREPSDFALTGGADVVASPLNSLRSGNPGEHTTASFVVPLAAGASLDNFGFQYRYDTGFGSTGNGSNFTVSFAGQALYKSPHLTDYSYSENRTNYSNPIDVGGSVKSVTVPNDGKVYYLEIMFDNNDRNVQLLLPLSVNLTCSDKPCIKTQPPQEYSLNFSPPNIVSGPECPTSQGGGPWWDKVHSVSDTHALGWAESHLIATADSGRSWNTLVFNDSCSTCEDGTSRFAYDHGPGFHTLGELELTKGDSHNISELHANSSTRFFVDTNGLWAQVATAPVTIANIPNLKMFGIGSGDCLTLPDSSMVCVQKSILSTGSGRLSCVAVRSLDGGFHWTFASVVASAAEVPYASEGPSESTLAMLTNGTLMAMMRVEGQSGHYSPYISKLSNDGGLTWHSLRSLSSGGEGLSGAGCVRPRLMRLGNSLVLSGGRPNPLSRDVLVWLNSAGDGEEWEAYSISYYHNLHTSNQNWLWPEQATNNSKSFPRITPSYTSLVRTGNSSGYVLYGMGVRSFTLPFQLTKRSQHA